MNTLITIVTKAGLLTEDLDDHVVRAAMVILLLFFGYQAQTQQGCYQGQ
jgi:hypothetical protein